MSYHAMGDTAAASSDSASSKLVLKYAPKIGYMGLNKATDAITANILSGGGQSSDIQNYAKTAGTAAGAALCAPYGPVASMLCGKAGGLLGGILGGLFGNAPSVPVWQTPDTWTKYYVPRIQEAQYGIAAVRRYLTLRDQLMDQIADLMTKLDRTSAYIWANNWLNTHGVPAAPIDGRWAPRADLWNTYVKFVQWAEGDVTTWPPFDPTYAGQPTQDFKRSAGSSQYCSLIEHAPGGGVTNTNCSGYRWIKEWFTAAGAPTPVETYTGLRLQTGGWGQCDGLRTKLNAPSCASVLISWYYPGGVPAYPDSAIDWGMVGAFQIIAGSLFKKTAAQPMGLTIPDDSVKEGQLTVCTASAVKYGTSECIIADKIPAQLAWDLSTQLASIAKQALGAALAVNNLSDRARAQQVAAAAASGGSDWLWMALAAGAAGYGAYRLLKRKTG